MMAKPNKQLLKDLRQQLIGASKEQIILIIAEVAKKRPDIAKELEKLYPIEQA